MWLRKIWRRRSGSSQDTTTVGTTIEQDRRADKDAAFVFADFGLVEPDSGSPDEDRP